MLVSSRINYSKQWMTWILQTLYFSTSWMYLWILSISCYYKSYKTWHYSMLIYEPYFLLYINRCNIDMDFFHVGIVLNMPYTQGLGFKSFFLHIYLTPNNGYPSIQIIAMNQTHIIVSKIVYSHLNLCGLIGFSLSLSLSHLSSIPKSPPTRVCTKECVQPSQFMWSH